MDGKNILHGYRTFADFIATDDELFIFRRFDRLNARNLLYLQSELIALETQLSKYDSEDIEDGRKDVILSARCWETLALRAEEHPREAERMELIRKIRKITKKYNEALVLQSQVLKIGRPPARTFTVFSNWFQTAKPFLGRSRDLLQDEIKFVALKASCQEDRLTRIFESCTGLFISCMRRKSKQQNSPTYYSDRIVQNIVTVFSIICATLLLEAAIVALYVVTNVHIRFGLIAVFTTMFATALNFLSNARLAEMFGASAAYAAVLVVFLAANLNSDGEIRRNGSNT